MSASFRAAVAELFKLGGAQAPPEEAIFWAALLLIPLFLVLIIGIVSLVWATSGPTKLLVVEESEPARPAASKKND
jgi:hypothetical protein